LLVSQHEALAVSLGGGQQEDEAELAVAPGAQQELDAAAAERVADLKGMPLL
jgi:hypothetical protein